LIDKAKAAEPQITSKVEQVVKDVPNARQEGLKFALKGEDSLKRKIAGIIADNTGIEAATARINDAVRYTMVVEDASYVVGVEKGLARLETAGFEKLEVKNSWAKNRYEDAYRGINTVWRDPATGQVFEFQFHTEKSVAAKQFEHPWYELQRVPGVDPLEVAFAKAQAELIFGEVPFPNGAVRIPNYPE
jgi:hypothetical protein